jgi:trimeric autotransporter adhesin
LNGKGGYKKLSTVFFSANREGMKSRVKTFLRMCCVVIVSACPATALFGASGDENWDPTFGTPGVEGTISAMAVSGNDLYVGGLFSRIGGVNATNVARWDGTNWNSLGPGLGIQPDRFRGVRAILATGNELYAAGGFTNSGSESVSHLVKWDGTTWISVGNSFGTDIVSLGWDGRYVYVGGTFQHVAGILASNIARWDGSNWSALGHGVHYWLTGIVGGPQDYGAVYSMSTFENSLVVAGQIEMAGGIRTTNLARWNGTQWSAVRDGSSLNPGPLLADDSRLYTGYRRGIVCYNGTTWSALGPSNDEPATVAALVKSGPDLFAGGSFTSLGQVPLSHVARWNSSQWSALGQGIGAVSGGGVFAMISNGSDLFVAGVFTSAGGKPATNIARWRIPHELKIRRSADKALLSWPATGSNLFLEATLNPADANWTILSNPPGLHGGECVVTNPVTDPARFYRLRGR